MRTQSNLVRIPILLALALFLSLPVYGENGIIEKRDHVCMMQDSVMEKPGVPVQYEGRTYYGCCPMCSGKITSQPEKYTKAKDPVTQVTVDKATALLYGYNGRAYYFDSEASRATFSENPGKFVQTAAAP